MSIKFPNLKRFFSLFLAAVMMVSLLAVNAHAANANKITDYGDAYGHWAYEALAWAVDNGVLVGTSEDKLNPDGYLTRAQMAAMIDRLFGTYKSADISRFTDAPRGSWHHDYIAQAVHMGTFAGYSSSRMGPNENITREQAMVVLARTICLPSAGNSTLARFPDRNQVGAWAADAVAAMVERGYVSGYNDGRLNPKGQITRAEMAQIMCSIFQSVHDSGNLTGTYRGTVLVRGSVSIKDAVFESGWGMFRVRGEIPALFTGEADQRYLFFTDGQTQYLNKIDDQSNGFFVTKWTNLTDNGQTASNTADGGVNTDYPLFRLADVYLMMAEAVVRGGTGSDRGTVLGYINELQRRAYGDDEHKIADSDLTLDFLLKERARELYWEGHRRTDLIRYGMFTTDKYLWQWKGGEKGGTAVNSKYNIYPIPNTELTANPNLYNENY